MRAIRDFVARDSPGAAEVLTDRMFESVGRLEEFPLSGREVPEFGRPELREVILGSYRIIYRTRGVDLIEVLTVLHSARLLAPRLAPGAGQP